MTAHPKSAGTTRSGPGRSSCPLALADGAFPPEGLRAKIQEGGPLSETDRQAVWTCLLCPGCPAGFSAELVRTRRRLAETRPKSPTTRLLDAALSLRPRGLPIPESLAHAKREGRTLMSLGTAALAAFSPDSETAHLASWALAKAYEALDRAELDPFVSETEPVVPFEFAWQGRQEAFLAAVARAAEFYEKRRVSQVVTPSRTAALALREGLSALGLEGPRVSSLEEALDVDPLRENSQSLVHQEPALFLGLFHEDPSPDQGFGPGGSGQGTCGVRGFSYQTARAASVRARLFSETEERGFSEIVTWDLDVFCQLARHRAPGTWVTTRVRVRFGPEGFRPERLRGDSEPNRNEHAGALPGQGGSA